MNINKVVLLPQDVDTLVTADCWGKNYVCVCVCVEASSNTTGYEAAYE